MSSGADTRNGMIWVRKVHEDAYFRCIPEMVSFEEGREFAFLLDGFQVAGGMLASFAVTNRVVGDFCRYNRPRASALDMWVALYSWHRAHKRGGLPLDCEDEVLNQRLVGHLRVALKRMNGRQRAGIMGVLRHAERVSR